MTRTIDRIMQWWGGGVQAPDPGKIEGHTLPEDERRFALFRRTIARMPGQRQQVFLFCRAYGYSCQDIVVRMGLPHDVVEAALRAALSDCCRAMEEVPHAA